MLTGFKKVLKPKEKRIKRTAEGTYYPQYKGLLFWRTYRNPRNGHFERFHFEVDVKAFLRAKHTQDLKDIENYQKRSTYRWNPDQ